MSRPPRAPGETLALLRQLFVAGGVKVRTPLSQVCEHCRTLGVPIPSLPQPHALAMESFVQANGVVVLSVASAVLAPSTLEVAWTLHEANVNRTLAPLAEIQTWAEQFERRTRWTGRALAIGCTTASLVLLCDRLRHPGPLELSHVLWWISALVHGALGAGFTFARRPMMRWLVRQVSKALPGMF